MSNTVDDVKEFWESNPLWAGETAHEVGSREYFLEHREVVIGDCFAGHLDKRLFPCDEHKENVLDLGCGPGFWTVELAQRNCARVVAADLTENALEIAKKRCKHFDIAAEFACENAESLTFPDGTFSHVNCQGVIHHTPDTVRCVHEIARVLKPGGTACLSVYYRNVLLRIWPALRIVGRALHRLGGGLKGRGREGIFSESDTDEIVRLYDGGDNPIGKCYSKREWVTMLEPIFEITSVFYHFFPARALPVRVPAWVHRILDRRCPFMIYATVRKR
jgi:2-polyprenyl-3-methyl-5-hydroxy-6-metoxy-1,4-benzoquinol methylase